MDRLEGEGPPVEADTVPAVDRKPFISLRSFCRFFLPPGPVSRNGFKFKAFIVEGGGYIT